MFQNTTDFTLYYDNKPEYYQSLVAQLSALLSIERDPVTNMAQTSAFIFQSIPELNWAGFYLNDKDTQLKLGPFQGKVACVHIPFGRGVCGRVAQTREAVCVNNVHQFEGHIACDSASNAEIVIPIIVDDKLIGVLDIDSPKVDRFTNEDVAGMELLVASFIEATQI